jgi:hypothetical protein
MEWNGMQQNLSSSLSISRARSLLWRTAANPAASYQTRRRTGLWPFLIRMVSEFFFLFQKELFARRLEYIYMLPFLYRLYGTTKFKDGKKR